MKDRLAAKLIELAQYRDRVRVFRDRSHAGEILAGILTAAAPDDAVVLAVPAGGVPVGREVAQRLNLPLDLLVVSKITLPWDTEAGYGAVAFDGTVRINEALVQRLRLSREDVDEGISRTREKVARREALLRGGRPLPEFRGRPAIVVDDGLASGYTLSVGVAALRKHGVEKVIVAVPTGHLDSVEILAREADFIYCANIRSGWRFAVADAYQLWSDVAEEELLEMVAGLFNMESRKQSPE
ncbi:MAG TPA: phosphoribosyltransferase family protein [Syntrophobacteria bacterium]|nr:phosphoribosyltransferase family protein [Syntrophobacteria bacterium]